MASGGRRIIMGALYLLGNTNRPPSGGRVSLWKNPTGNNFVQLNDFPSDEGLGNSHSEFGASVSISGNGRWFAAGAPGTDGTMLPKAVVYREDPNDGNKWKLFGDEILGNDAGNEEGSCVSVVYDSNGDTVYLAIGARSFDRNTISNTGRVRVYSRPASDDGTGIWNGVIDTTTWDDRRMGGGIRGEAVDDFTGTACSLSDDGRRIAVGEPGYDGGNGRVRVFEFDADQSIDDWVMLGSSNGIVGQSGKSGSAVALSRDGTTVAIGSPEANSNRGRVTVHKFDVDGSGDWVQVGENLSGPTNSQFGSSVDLSDNGNTLVVGAPLFDPTGSPVFEEGNVRVYRYNEFAIDVSDVWVRLSDSQFVFNGRSGQSVALSGDGETVAYGSPFATVGPVLRVGEFCAYERRPTT